MLDKEELLRRVEACEINLCNARRALLYDMFHYEVYQHKAYLDLAIENRHFVALAKSRWETRQDYLDMVGTHMEYYKAWLAYSRSIRELIILGNVSTKIPILDSFEFPEFMKKPLAF
jgi:hypothetical protein